MMDIREIVKKRLNVYFIGGVRYVCPPQIEQVHRRQVEHFENRIAELEAEIRRKELYIIGLEYGTQDIENLREANERLVKRIRELEGEKNEIV